MFLLSIIGVWSVLTTVVLLDEQGVHRSGWGDAKGNKGHFGALFHDFGVIDGIVGRCSPRERPVVFDEHGGRMVGVYLADV